MAEPSSADDLAAAAFRARQRREKIAARLAMTRTDHAHASALLEDHLVRLLADRPPARIAFCWPIRNEFDCRPLVVRLLASGWRACQPVVAAAATPMVFRDWCPAAAMTHDRHGIPIPDTETVAAPEVILLPLVAFDPAGYRLGYGGGYFDRTLAGLTPSPFSIGVGFELARVDSVRPMAHDRRLDAIITEAGIHETRSAAC